MFECTIKGCAEPAVELHVWMQVQEDFQPFFPLCKKHAEAYRADKLSGTDAEAMTIVGMHKNGTFEVAPIVGQQNGEAGETGGVKFTKLPEPEICCEKG